MREMTGFNELREHSWTMWIEQEQGWVAAPEEIVTALSSDGLEECKREMTTSRRHRRSAVGLWQGVDPRTGSVASAIWVTHGMRRQGNEAAMGKRMSSGSGDSSGGLLRERPSDDGQATVDDHGVSEGTRSEALDHRPCRQNSECDRADPALERDPYQDEGGEG